MIRAVVILVGVVFGAIAGGLLAALLSLILIGAEGCSGECWAGSASALSFIALIPAGAVAGAFIAAITMRGRRERTSSELRYALLLADGQRAKPAVFLTTFKNWRQGDEIHFGGSSFRIVALNSGEPGAATRDGIDGTFVVEPIVKNLALRSGMPATATSTYASCASTVVGDVPVSAAAA